MPPTKVPPAVKIPREKAALADELQLKSKHISVQLSQNQKAAAADRALICCSGLDFWRKYPPGPINKTFTCKPPAFATISASPPSATLRWMNLI
jgi:hypothetical protein